MPPEFGAREATQLAFDVGPARSDTEAVLASADTELVPGVALHPAVARWFRRRFGDPTPPQRQGWPAVDRGEHTLIAAPTGSGKTLAGFLMAINSIYLQHAAGKPPSGTQVVYVSPLKALASDIAQNLETPLAEIAEVALTMGLAVPEITVGVRTGDTSPSERQSMLRRPRTFLITTPESLYLLATAAKSRELLRGVGSVIVDEIHAMVRDKRGSHLSLTLERLEHLCHRPPVRIGLSATQRPIETVARFLVGTRCRQPLGSSGSTDSSPATQVDCTIVDTGGPRRLDIALELPDAELEAVASHQQMDWVMDRMAKLVTEHHTTLIFVNTRRLAERLAHQLGERLGEDCVAAHHGSLSKDRRHRVEHRLRTGELSALVATASLELGIDIGPIELVCQLGSPRSIATFMQRIGRANHHRDGTPKGRLFPLTRDELVECSGLLAAARSGRLDALHPPEAPLDILAQQLVAESGAEDWSTDRLFKLFTQAAPYSQLTRSTFDRVVELCSEGIVTGRGRRAAWVHHDREAHELRGRRGARWAALTSGGAIPEIYDMRVVLEPDETFIGSVTEDWATESSAGDIFLLGTNSWRIRQVTGGQVRVTDAGDAPPTIPVWAGEAPARSAELSQEVSEIRRIVEQHLARADPDAARRELARRCGIDETATTTIVAYLAAGRAALGCLPTTHHLVMERFFDDADGTQLVIHSPLGGRINRAMGYALRKKFCVGFNFELQAAASDDAVVISLGPHHSFPLDDVQRFLRPGNIRKTLEQAVLDQPAFQSRWRWNLNRALVVLRMRNGRRNPPPIQRMESDDLLAAVFPDAAACQENVSGPATIPDHPLVQQTIHDTLTEGLDVDGLIELWEALEAGTVTMTCVESAEPSILAHEILTARPYAFLDDDAEVAERRTRAVPLRRGLPTNPTDIAAIDDETVKVVRAELAPDPRTGDELHDLLSDVVVLAAQDSWRELFDGLLQQGRVIETGGYWSASTDAEAIRVLRSGQADGELFPELIASRSLRGHLELHSPATVSQLSLTTGIGESLVGIALAALEADGSAIQGRFTDEARRNDQVEWASRRVLSRLHRRARSGRRRAVQSASPEEFVRFLTQWQHVAPGSQLEGREGLLRAIEQLQGWPAAVASWEPQLLRARVPAFQAAWLDQLCHDGLIQWLRLRPPAPTSASDDAQRSFGPSKATPVSLVQRSDLEWLLAGWRGPETPEVPPKGAVAEIAEILNARGARFASELARDTRRLPTDIESALWEAAARGLVTADGFQAVRDLTEKRASHRKAHPRPLSRLRSGASSLSGAGRWSLVPDPPSADDIEFDDLAEAAADQLLQRWGVVFYDLVAAERLHLRWRDLQWALRRMEDRGLVRGGRFVGGFSGEQFALPAAAEQLQALRSTRPSGRTVTVCGSDPLNLTAVVLPGSRVAARRGTSIDLPV